MTYLHGCFSTLLGASLLALLLCGCGDQLGEVPPPTANTGAMDPGTGEPEPIVFKVESIEPDRGDPAGDTLVTIRGVGFDDMIGVEVLFGLTPATDVEVVDDNTVMARTPPGAPGLTAVQLQNTNGSDVLIDAFAYVYVFFFAADGKGGVPGSLYLVDPADASTTEVGEIGFAVTGLAMSPTGELFATEATKRNKLGQSRLFQIDPLTGKGTPIGPLTDVSGVFVHGAIPDLTFFGARLLGWTQDGDVPVEIDLDTGTVTPIGDSVSSYGSGMADRGDGRVVHAPEGSGGHLWELNPETGVSVIGAGLSGATIGFSAISALAFHEGKMYGIENEGGSDSASELLAIDPDTGVMTHVGSLPSGVAALVSATP